MRVAVVTHKLVRTDGQGKINYELALRLADRGHRLELVSTELDGPLAGHPRAAWHPVALPRWAKSELLRNQLFAAGSARRLRALGESGGVDAVLANGGITHHPADVNVAMFVHAHWRRLAVHPARRGAGANAAYQWLYSAVNAAWERRAFAGAAVVVALSDQVRDSLVRDAGVDPAKVEIIHCGVDLDTFRPAQAGEPAPLRDECGVGPGGLLVAFVGDIASNRKNLDLVLWAVAAVPGVSLVIAGNPRRSPYPDMARRMGLVGRARFLGVRSDVPAILRQADAFVFPSHYDPWALVVPEALASGVPAVAGPEVGASSLIRHGENGFLLDHSDDLAGCVAALTTLRDDPDRLVSMRLAARASAEALTWDAMADAYEAVLRRAAAARRGVPTT